MLASSIFVKTMIELTTGVAFLVSSLYGSSQMASPMQTVTTGDQAQTQTVSTTSIQSTSTSTTETQAYLRKQFGDDAILVDIARCESNYHQFDKNGIPVRGIVNNADVGVMQINEKYHADMAKKLGYDLYTLEGNVAYAKHLYEEQGTAPWNSSAKCWSGDLAKK
jgi:phage tail tube protein FII